MTTILAGTPRSQSTSLPSRPLTRPLTPPEFDSDCFLESHAHGASQPPDKYDGPLRLEPGKMKTRPKLATSATEPAYTNGILKPLHNESDMNTFAPEPPVTPIKTPWSSGLLLKDDVPQYPYTPESIRSTKSHGIRPLSPLPSIPWNTRGSCSSPMQDALLSCAAQLDNLIQMREPTDEQMEYLVSRFEEMARFLSAPEAQSKQTDDHLFSEVEGPADTTGLGIVDERPTGDRPDAYDLALSQGYILEVGRYIESVKTHVHDLTTRMDEVKQLNSIQLDIIGDLRQELKNKSSQLKQEKEASAQEQRNMQKIPPQSQGFWSAIGEALDAVGEMLHEW